MEIQKVDVKIFAKDAPQVDLRDFYPIFNRWIQEQKNEENLLDVADYSLVPGGPGMMLVAFEANFQLEYGPEERFGLRYSVKVPRDGSNRERIRHAIDQVLKAAERLEADDNLPAPLQFDRNEIKVLVNSREIAPNTKETYDALLPDFSAVSDSLFGKDAYSIENASTDSRERFQVRIFSEASLN